MRHLALLIFLTSFMLPNLAATNTPPVTPPSSAHDNTESASAEQTGCNNDKNDRWCLICDESTNYEWMSVICGDTTSGGSTILNGRHSYLLESTDYEAAGTGTDGPGCGPCGATSSVGVGGLPSLVISRIHRSRTMSYVRSSFGRQHFLAEYDRKLVLLKNANKKIRYTNVGGYDNKMELHWDASRAGWAIPVGENFHVLSLFDVAGAPIAAKANRDQARSGIILHHDGSSEHFEIFWKNGTGVGRLTSLMDRNGNEVELIYANAINANGQVNNFAWQMRLKTIRDAYGREAQITNTKLGGWYNITKIVLPNGEQLDYSYGSLQGHLNFPALTQVDHPDGTQSTYTGTEETSRGYVKIEIFEAAAEATDRRKTLRYTLNSGFDSSGNPASQTPGFVRQVENGEGETTHASRSQGSSVRYIYEGGNRVKRLEMAAQGGAPSIRRVTDTAWHGGFHSTDATTWQTEEVATRVYDNRPMANEETDPLGRLGSITRVPISGTPTGRNYADGTSRVSSYNGFDQPLTRTDRLGRLTTFLYDAIGDLTSETSGSGTADAATVTFLHNARGQVTEERDAEYAPGTPELHNTQYVYDADGYLTDKIEAADIAGGTRPTTIYAYDAAGRLETTTDPLGRVTTYAYDVRGRHFKTTYHDGSFEETVYGVGGDANMVIERIDRNGISTTYEYDDADRHVIITHAAGTPEAVTEECEYLWGTKLKSSCTIRGERTDYGYDYDNRLVETTRHADANTPLASTKEIDQIGRVRTTTDPYGRRTFYLRDQNDRVSRTVTETVPGGVEINNSVVPAIVPNSVQTSVPKVYSVTTTSGETIDTVGTHEVTYSCPRDTYLVGLPRDLSDNAPYLIVDSIHDAEGQRLVTTDARGHETWTIYDNLGRATRTFRATATADEILTETDYDRNSNRVEVRHPRHFAEGIDAIDSWTYNGRNLVASHTVADGSLVEATESWTYYADGRQEAHTDFRGNVFTTIWHTCCGRLQASVDRDGSSTSIRNTDFEGNLTHSAVVSSNPGGNWHDPADAETLQESTARFDGLGRPTHQTAWLAAQGTITDHARTNLGTGEVPIAGLDGIPATDGLTTTYAYDEDLTDGVGIDLTYATAFTALAARNVTFGAGADGSAVEVTNPEGETSVRVQDGLGRTVMTINGMGEINTMRYDVLGQGSALAAGAPWATDVPLPGDYIGSVSADSLGNTTTTYQDGAGRSVVTAYPSLNPPAATDSIGAVAYDANGNAVVTRDPNGLGHDCTFDTLDRRVDCADLQEQAEGTSRGWDYNAHGQVTSATEAAGNSDATTYDERGRTVSSTDRNALTTTYGYDANGNLESLTDPAGKERTWQYNSRDLVTLRMSAAHVPGSAPGAAGHDAIAYQYDALRRADVRSDQLGRDIDYDYDLAGRMVEREYRAVGGAVESTDTLDYDGANRLVYGYKGRYDVITDLTYDEAGRPTFQVANVFGFPYGTTATYDGAGRWDSLGYPGGGILDYDYDTRSQIESATFAGQILNVAHDAAGRETSRTFPNGLSQSITYGRSDNRRTLDETTGNGAEGMRYGYSYDVLKRVTEEDMIDGGPGLVDEAGFTASYDAGDRITAWDRDDSAPLDEQEWTYDGAGNWASTKIEGSNQGRAHDGADQVTSIGGQNVSWSATGTLLEDHRGNEYEWDQDDRLMAKTDDGQNIGTADYKYDVLGRRVGSEDNSGNKLVHLWWGDREIGDYVGDPNANQHPVPTQIFLQLPRHNDWYARVSYSGPGATGEVNYYHKNYLDHVYAISDSDGDVQEYVRYSAFGEAQFYDGGGSKEDTSPTGNQITWNCKRLDPITGLHVYKYRHYDAGMGRWASRDPISEKGGTNLYAFVGNNSLNNIDFLGLIFPAGQLCTAADCDKDKCPAAALGEDWGEGWGEIPEPGDCMDADAVATPKGILKIPNGNVCTIECDEEGNPTRIVCTQRRWWPNPLQNPGPDHGFPPNPFLPEENANE